MQPDIMASGIKKLSRLRAMRTKGWVELGRNSLERPGLPPATAAEAVFVCCPPTPRARTWTNRPTRQGRGGEGRHRAGLQEPPEL